jgi:glycolate oxidase
MSIESASEFATVHEIIKTAHKKLPRGVWDYVVGGTDTETTLRRNRMALDSIAFRPRVMRDVTRRKAAASFMGKDLRMPVILAPVGSLEMVEPDGAATSAKAAELFNVVHMLSSRAEPGLEGTVEDDHVKRAIDNGYFAFAITVDLDIYTRRERDHANRYGRIRQKATEGNGFTFQAAYTWDNVKRFKDKHDIPLILKGIGSVEDAVKAVEHGVEGVYVSNHGGRALDTGRGAIAVLPEIVAEIGGKAKIIYDGGVMRGSDIVKAMILGADAVGVGRLQCLGMAAAGVPGLLRVLELLEEEILIAFGLMGVNGWDELDESYICPAEPVDEPHVFSQHPMVQLEPYRY